MEVQIISHMLHVRNIYLHLPHKWASFVGKYTSTMEHLGIDIFINLNVYITLENPPICWWRFWLELSQVGQNGQPARSELSNGVLWTDLKQYGSQGLGHTGTRWRFVERRGTGFYHGKPPEIRPGKLLHNWLVVWNMSFIFHFIYGNVIIPTDELIFFQRGRSTTNQTTMERSTIFNG